MEGKCQPLPFHQLTNTIKEAILSLPIIGPTGDTSLSVHNQDNLQEISFSLGGTNFLVTVENLTAWE